MYKTFVLLCGLVLLAGSGSLAQNKALVFQTDFGLKDGAVSAMKGVAFGVSPTLKLFDLTHEIPAYNIWEAACRLEQTALYWPKGTVFVSVVDPGVGSERKSVVLKTRSGHFFVTPDNGTLTLVAPLLGIEAIRQIDETKHRLPRSGSSYTFHGRDVYAYTGARLAAGVITFEEVGPKLPNQFVQIPYQKPQFDNGVVKGTIPILDVQYGNVWTNIDEATFKKLSANYSDTLSVRIHQRERLVYEGQLVHARTFSDVPDKKELSYFNSLMHLSFAINMGNFAQQHQIQSGPEWLVEVRKAK